MGALSGKRHLALVYGHVHIPTLPYVQLRSRSTGQSFQLCIARSETQSHGVSGTFTAYGL